MSDSERLSDVVGQGDPGDVVLERFDFQSTYTAQLAAGLLMEGVPFQELFCEHHEDILILLKDGSYHAVQIKTRRPNLEPFKANDEPMVSAIRKFANLELDYAGQIARYVLVSNVGFWDASKQDKNNLHYLISISKLLPLERKTKANSDLFEYVDGFSNKSDRSRIFSVLKKLELETATSRFGDLQAVLVKILGEIPDLRTKNYAELSEIANHLRNDIKSASQREIKEISEFFVYQKDPQACKDRALIEGKRITELRVSELVAKYSSHETRLRTGNATSLDDLPVGMNRATLKMAAGKLSAENIEIMSDCKFSAEYEMGLWIQKYGPTKATERYQHLLTITRNACQESHDRTFDKTTAFGTNMLLDVRNSLRELSSLRSADVFNLGPEILLGVAGILTESCKLWWSDQFETGEKR